MNGQTADGTARPASAAGDGDARLWGVGQFAEGGHRVPYPVSAADIEADTRAAGRALGSLGIGRGHTVLFVSLVSEIVQVVPFHDALGRFGGICSAADATPFDATRTAKLVGQLHPRAVLGVNVDVLDGLEQAGFDLADAFAGVPVLGAHPGAAVRLEGAGLAPRIWAFLGPAVGVECEPGVGAHIDESVWIVDDEDGEVVVAPRAERAIGPARHRTGVRGPVVRGPCRCGRADARVRIAPEAGPGAD
jgi:hypothetical protein